MTLASEHTDILGDPIKERYANRLRQMTDLERQRLIHLAKPRVIEPYTKHIPHPAQQVFLSLQCREAMYGGAAGGGKLQPVTHMVLTPKGWRRIGELVEGDTVVDPRTGGSATVIAAFPPVEQDEYVVTTEDGGTTAAGPDHLWTVRCSGKRTKGWDRRRSINEDDEWLHGYKIVTTNMLMAHVERAKQQTVNGKRPNYPHIPVPRAVEFTRAYRNANATLPIDPYLLGLLLGDGWYRNGKINICSDDGFIVSQIQVLADRPVSTRVEDGKGKDGKFTYVAFKASDRENDWLVEHDLDMARSWTKHIPEDYLFAPLEWRKALMQGLMDTDGYVDDRGHMSYSTVSKQLAEDVQHLARSLGAKVSITSKKTSFTHKGKKKIGRLAYNVWITPHDPSFFVRLPRKLKRVRESQHQPAREVVNVRPTGRTITMRCIKLDTLDGLYITDDFIVTHNSDALLMAALQYVDVPGYSALLLRRTWPDLNAPGAILDRARTWFADTDVKQRDGGRIMEFPNGGRIQFGTMQYARDKHKYQSAEYQFIGFDELTHFEENMYTYMFSRNRRPDVSCLNCRTNVRRYTYADGHVRWKHTSLYGRQNCKKALPDPAVVKQYSGSLKNGMTLFDVPLRMRSATNPGGIGHQWVKERFVDPRTKIDGAIFVPARLTDNPSLDQESYRESLGHLLPLDRERLLNGDWDVMEEGDYFARHNFNSVEKGPNTRERVRYWDMAATEGGGDWTVGALVSHHEGRWCIEDIVRFQNSPPNTEKIIFQTAMADRVTYGQIQTVMEEEPGSAGKTAISHYQRNILPGFAFRGNRTTGDKTNRAKPVASAAQAGNVDMVAAAWNRDFLDEAALFPNGQYDDMVDAVSGAVECLAFGRRSRLIV